MRRYHHGNVREAAIEACREMVRDSGAEGVTARSVADAIGVSATALYRHFEDMADLFREVASRALGYLADALDGADTWSALAERYLAWAVAEPHLFGLAFGEHGTGHPGGIRDVGEGAPPRAQRAFESLAVDETEAIMAWGLIHGISTLAVGGALGTQTGRDPFGIMDAAIRRAMKVPNPRGST